MKIKLLHCKTVLYPVHRWDLPGQICTTSKDKLQTVSNYDDVRIYEFDCPKCHMLVRAWMGIGFNRKLSPLIQIKPRDWGIWERWLEYRDLVDPQGVDTVKRSKPVFPFTMQTVPVA